MARGNATPTPPGPPGGPDGWFHVHWVWRDTPDCATNSHLSYARSRDLIRWESAFGENIDLPIRYDQAAPVVDAIPAGGGIINGGHRMEFDAGNKPVFVYHKSDADGNMQLYAARPEDGKWKHRTLTTWKHPVPFDGGGSMPFIGIGIGVFEETGPDVFTVSHNHKDHGAGALSFEARTLDLLDKPAPAIAALPRGIGKTDSDFPGMQIRHAGDLGTCGTPGVRYLRQWETLGPNRDRPRQPPLPAPSTLRLHKITEARSAERHPK
jgi:hypothetical protein